MCFIQGCNRLLLAKRGNCVTGKFLVSIVECEYNPSLIAAALKVIITFLCLIFGCYEFASVLENRKEIMEEKGKTEEI